jgi:hypothetical protein
MKELHGQNYIKDNKDLYSVSLDFPHKEVIFVLNKKASNMLTALYMITHFVPKGDPIRQALRRSGINVLSFLNHYADTDSLTSQKNVLNVLNEIDHTLSLLKVCNGAGFISQMNYRLVSEYLDGLRDNFEMLARVTRKSPSHELELPKDLFEDDKPLNDPVKDKKQDKSVIKDNVSVTKGQNKKESKGQNLDKISKPEVSKRSRIQAIATAMRGKGKLSISDIFALIEGWSQKTIQREVNDLVKDKKIRRFGEKRWSMYELLV